MEGHFLYQTRRLVETLRYGAPPARVVISTPSMVFSPTTLHDSVKDPDTNAGEGLAESDDCYEICAQPVVR